MRRYDIYKLDGDQLRYIKRYTNRNKADEYLAYDTEKSTFFVMNCYCDYSDNGNWMVTSSILYLNGVPVKHYKNKIVVDDIKKYQKKLARVYTTDGDMYYINNRQLTNRDVFDIVGGWGSVKVVQDEPERWAIIHRDVAFILQGKSDEKLPPLNAQASVKFGMTLYGDVIFINENYC